MARDSRIIDEHRNRINYSCKNRRFSTNTNKGYQHGQSPTKGSVFPTPLINHEGYTLWLEHVEDIDSGAEVYWLMWYDPDGTPTIPMSGIFDKLELAEMSKQLTGFVP